eukprot:5086959-Pyramimonas_sp.AAC.1
MQGGSFSNGEWRAVRFSKCGSRSSAVLVFFCTTRNTRASQMQGGSFSKNGGSRSSAAHLRVTEAQRPSR